MEKTTKEKQKDTYMDIIDNCSTTFDFITFDIALLKDTSYSIESKVKYAKKYKRNRFLKDLYEDIKKNYFTYDSEAILYMVFHHLKSEEKTKFYLLEAFAKTEDILGVNFRNELIKHNKYEEFKAALRETPSTSLKYKAVIFMDPSLLDDLFHNKSHLINSFHNSALSTKEKINYLLAISRRIDLNKEEIELIRETLIDFAQSYKTKLDEQLATIDQELVEVNQILYDHDLSATLKELNDNAIKSSYSKK